MSDLPTHNEWATTLHNHADGAESPGDADYWRYYGDQHANAAARERGTGCRQDRRR